MNKHLFYSVLNCSKFSDLKDIKTICLKLDFVEIFVRDLFLCSYGNNPICLHGHLTSSNLAR